MGFFSWNCKKCSHSIKSPYDIPSGWEYMNEAVYLKPNGSIVIGDYDGYGRVGNEGHEIDWEAGEPELWHKRCWENAGKPGFSGSSKYSEDQGFFYATPTDEEKKEALQHTVN